MIKNVDINIFVKDLVNNKSDISVRKLIKEGKTIYILYIPSITNKDRLSTHVIKPILQYPYDNLTTDIIAHSIIYIDDVYIYEDENKILDYILDGNSVILMCHENKYIVTNTLKVEKRSIDKPEIQNAIKGPKDSFTESLETNLSLIRHRVKDPNLKVDYTYIGKRTKTQVATIYIDDVINPKYVHECKSRLESIDIDGILESGYIQKLISNKTISLFPETGICERPDKACASILNGKLCIIVDGSNLAILLPQTFIDFLDSGDDHYDNLYLSLLIKFIRILSFFISLSLSSFYVALVSFHPDFLPPSYILALAVARATVPVNALIEATLMEFVAELLKEASLRLPKQIGPAIGIVGTIVIGQAAVSAGLVSPLMVIIISLSTMTSFIVPDYTIMNPIRILKFGLIFLTGALGLFGFVIGITFIIVNLVSTSSFGVPYTSPIAPININDMKEFVFSDIRLNNHRPGFLKTKNKKRKK